MLEGDLFVSGKSKLKVFNNNTVCYLCRSEPAGDVFEGSCDRVNCQSIVRTVFQRDSQILTFCFFEKDIFDGLTVILKKIRAMGKPVVVNGGDIYVTAYQSRYGSAADIMTGVNQESVWSRIDFTTKTFHTQKKTEREYFCQYLQACKADGMDVYLLEYTTDHKLIRRIKKYCRKKKYDYYIADSLELGI